MGRENERDTEKLLCGGAFSNPLHKEALRARLFGDARELGPDELVGVTGGTALPTPEDRGLWLRPQAERNG